MKIKCIIVDDEPLAIRVIEKFVTKIQNIEIVAKMEDAVKAFNLLQTTHIDLMFLDIQMPELTGIDLLKTLTNPPKVIITTAYSEYAIQGYELDIVDYLMKPVSFERFLTAINKFYRFYNYEKTNPVTELPDENQYLFVKKDKKTIKILLKEIMYIESLRDYIMISTDRKEIKVKYQISKIEKDLPEELFLRVHRSFIISIPKIEVYSQTQIEIGNKIIPIGQSYKSQVVKKLNPEN